MFFSKSNKNLNNLFLQGKKRKKKTACLQPKRKGRSFSKKKKKGLSILGVWWTREKLLQVWHSSKCRRRSETRSASWFINEVANSRYLCKKVTGTSGGKRWFTTIACQQCVSFSDQAVTAAVVTLSWSAFKPSRKFRWERLQQSTGLHVPRSRGFLQGACQCRAVGSWSSLGNWWRLAKMLWCRPFIFMFGSWIVSGMEWEIIPETQKTWNVHCRFSLRSYFEDQALQAGIHGRPANLGLPPGTWSICGHVQCQLSFSITSISICSNLLCLWMKTFTLFASLVGEAFAPSASLQLPFFSQEPYASLLATAGLPQACWRKNLRKKRSHLPHWNCPFSKKLLSFHMKCRDSRHEKGMMRRKINKLIKRR